MWYKKNIIGDITSKLSKVLVGVCVVCSQRKSMTASNNTIITKGFSGFLKNSVEKGLNVSKRMAKNVLSKPPRALDITQTLLQQRQTGNLKKYYQHYEKRKISIIGQKGLILKNLFVFKPSEWRKKHKNYTHMRHLKTLIWDDG